MKLHLNSDRILGNKSSPLPDSALSRQIGRITFLLTSLVVAAAGGGALYLLRSHAESRRVFLAVEYGFVLLGVFWLRSLERRLQDAGLPRWSFWPYFLIVFTGCLGAHVLDLTNSLQTLVLFLLLQLPAVLFPSERPLPHGVVVEGASSRSISQANKPGRPVTPLGAGEFAIYLVLIAGLWAVLHLLRGDVTGISGARAFKLALDAGSGIVCILWIFSVRGRLKALGRMRWTLYFCFVVLALCVLPFAFRGITFQHALVLFAVLQLPIAVLRRKFISARVFPADYSEEVDSVS